MQSGGNPMFMKLNTFNEELSESPSNFTYFMPRDEWRQSLDYKTFNSFYYEEENGRDGKSYYYMSFTLGAQIYTLRVNPED